MGYMRDKETGAGRVFSSPLPLLWLDVAVCTVAGLLTWLLLRFSILAKVALIASNVSAALIDCFRLMRRISDTSVIVFNVLSASACLVAATVLAVRSARVLAAITFFSGSALLGLYATGNTEEVGATVATVEVAFDAGIVGLAMVLGVALDDGVGTAVVFVATVLLAIVLGLPVGDNGGTDAAAGVLVAATEAAANVPGSGLGAAAGVTPSCFSSEAK